MLKHLNPCQRDSRICLEYVSNSLRAQSSGLIPQLYILSAQVRHLGATALLLEGWEILGFQVWRTEDNAMWRHSVKTGFWNADKPWYFYPIQVPVLLLLCWFCDSQHSPNAHIHIHNGTFSANDSWNREYMRYFQTNLGLLCGTNELNLLVVHCQESPFTEELLINTVTIKRTFAF